MTYTMVSRLFLLSSVVLCCSFPGAALAAEADRAGRGCVPESEPVPAAQERGRRTRSKDCVPVIEDHYVLPRERLQQLNELEKQRQREVFQLIEPGEHPLPAAGRGGWQ